jgi:hypothetical protein
LTHVPKVRTTCLIPTHHPTPKTKTGQHQFHPTILCTYPKEKGCGVGGTEYRENNGCGVNEWPFLLKNQKIVTCSIGLMYEFANFLMRLTFTITITKCFFSKDPNDYNDDNFCHR